MDTTISIFQLISVTSDYSELLDYSLCLLMMKEIESFFAIAYNYKSRFHDTVNVAVLRGNQVSF